jgi:hypothetical protein
MKKTLLLSFLMLAACVPKSMDLQNDKQFESQGDYYLVPEDSGSSDLSTVNSNRNKLSYLFLVEQFSVGANESMIKAIKKNPPGGILFWNGNGADSEKLKESITAYSQANEKAGIEPILFSTDYEGGANNKSPFGSTVPGVQRFSTGFTKLLHPRG